ncbi:MAG: nucleotidyltransferase domain-containing protein [Candidatus Bipolaricaulota bacterium]|nr:nucleotidyltransferase domain-containing protein [Candidatus Bipolaricaulota bacterium]
MSDVLDTLFGSAARVRVLSLFLENGGGEFYLREIAQKTGLALRSVQRVVGDLTDIGLLVREPRGNAVYFHLEREFPILPDLKSMFLKTTGLGALIAERIVQQGGVDVAFLYGSVAKGTEGAASDIDLAVVGQLAPRRLTACLAELERETGREINATLFTSAEWSHRRDTDDHFVATLLREPKILLVGRAELLEANGGE